MNHSHYYSVLFSIKIDHCWIVRSELLPQAKEFKLKATAALDWCGKEGAELVGKTFTISLLSNTHLQYAHELWVVTERMRVWIKVAEMSFPPSGGWAQHYLIPYWKR